MRRPLQDITFPSAKRRGEAKTFADRLEKESPSIRKAIFSKRMNFSQWEPLRFMDHSRLIIWGGAALSLLVLLFVLLSIFESATITVTPKQQTLALEAAFSAHRGTAPSQGLAFEIMTLQGEEKKALPATVVDRVDTHASGKLVIYNNFDSKSQQLVARTRFETKDGLIYRVREPVIVPGQKTVNGEKIPGSIEVTVHADEPGEKYNVGLSDFTVPGFKGTPRYGGFYARSSSPMAGGFSGVVKTVSADELDKARRELGETLRNKLLEKAQSQKPEHFVLYRDAVFFKLDDSGRPPIQADVNKNTVEISISGTLHGIIFNESTFAQFLAKTLIPTLAPTEKVTIKNVEDLIFTVSNKELFSPTEDTVLSFAVKGSPFIVWEYDDEGLRRDTAGKTKEEFKTVLAAHPSLQKAEVVLRPFWKGRFPEDPDRIRVETALNSR